MTNSVWHHLYVDSKASNKVVNVTEMNQTHKYREKLAAIFEAMEGEGAM